jgi:hypothetical protein
MSKAMWKVFLVSVFILGLTASVYAQPVNDLCADAIALGVPSITDGSTVGATADTAPGGCGPTLHPGIWYTVVGTGYPMVATTCEDFGGAHGYDTQISVYTGDCGSLTCLGGNDDRCNGLGSFVEWDSQLGTVYRILVHGFSGSTGTFSLSIYDERCIGQLCYVNVTCPIGSCPQSYCEINVPGLSDCFEVGQIEYCGCTPPCDPSECWVFIPVP